MVIIALDPHHKLSHPDMVYLWEVLSHRYLQDNPTAIEDISKRTHNLPLRVTSRALSDRSLVMTEASKEAAAAAAEKKKHELSLANVINGVENAVIDVAVAVEKTAESVVDSVVDVVVGGKYTRNTPVAPVTSRASCC